MNFIKLDDRLFINYKTYHERKGFVEDNEGILEGLNDIKKKDIIQMFIDKEFKPFYDWFNVRETIKRNIYLVSWGYNSDKVNANNI